MSDAKKVLLLSPALRKRVDEKVEACLEIARGQFPAVKFETPEIRYDVKNTDGGLAYGQSWLIRLNLILCFENEEHFVNTTVPHEVAHLVTRRVYGNTRKHPDGSAVLDKKTAAVKKVRSHGPEWASVMQLFGLAPKRCHSYDTTSIQKPKRKKRGALLSSNDVGSMMRRLENGIKRLPEDAKSVLQLWLSAHILTDGLGDES